MNSCGNFKTLSATHSLGNRSNHKEIYIMTEMLFFTIIISGAFMNTIAIDYCKLESCLEMDTVHTMCTYTSSTPASRCGKWRNRGLRDDEKQAIVNAHNAERQKVAAGNENRGNPGPQPPAINMSNLTWDNELEIIAQRWADQCIFGHDECRDVERFAVGQNVAQTCTSNENHSKGEELVQLWINEVNSFNKIYVSKLPEDVKNIGHYTQVVDSNTKMIGCGRIIHDKLHKCEEYILVCNYGPAGNYVGEPLYQIKK